MRIKPKKHLGQNFLIDKNILRKIAQNIELKSWDILFEIGAGKGELTELLADKTKVLYAFEIDKQLCRILETKFAGSNVKIINQDILKTDLSKYIPPPKKIKVLGNIPYNITTPIIEHLLKFKDNIQSIFITVQKEFARRIICASGSKEYGSLSCFVQYYTQPQILFPISRSCFRPVPTVDSCFLKLGIREAPAVNARDEKLFFKIIRTAFNQRRKTLRNSLKDMISENRLEDFFKKYNLDSNIRPECLNLEDFANLVNTI